MLDTPEVTKTPYPAETPGDSGLLEASFVDLHIQSSGPSPFVGSGQMEQDDNASFVDGDLVLSLLSSQRRATCNSVLSKYCYSQALLPVHFLLYFKSHLVTC